MFSHFYTNHASTIIDITKVYFFMYGTIYKYKRYVTVTLQGNIVPVYSSNLVLVSFQYVQTMNPKIKVTWGFKTLLVNELMR